MVTDYRPLDLDAQAEREGKSAEAIAKQIEQEGLDWTWLLNDQRGRRIVWRLLSGAGVFKAVFQPGDPHVTSFRDGMRNQGLSVLNLVFVHAPDAFARMQKENA